MTWQRPRNDNWEHVDYSEHDDRIQVHPDKLGLRTPLWRVEQLTDPPGGPDLISDMHGSTQSEHQWNRGSHRQFPKFRYASAI